MALQWRGLGKTACGFLQSPRRRFYLMCVQLKQVIAAASVNLRWHSAQTKSLCYKELLTSPKIRPSLILRFDMSEMDDCHTHEIQEKGDGIVFGFN